MNTSQVTCALERRLPLLERVLAVRVRAWLAKLREAVRRQTSAACARITSHAVTQTDKLPLLLQLATQTSNHAWLRNRNVYARLLLEQLRAGVLEVPFTALPPQGPLPTLPTYLTYRQGRERQAHTCRRRGGCLRL